MAMDIHKHTLNFHQVFFKKSNYIQKLLQPDRSGKIKVGKRTPDSICGTVQTFRELTPAGLCSPASSSHFPPNPTKPKLQRGWGWGCGQLFPERLLWSFALLLCLANSSTSFKVRRRGHLLLVVCVTPGSELIVLAVPSLLLSSRYIQTVQGRTPCLTNTGVSSKSWSRAWLRWYILGEYRFTELTPLISVLILYRVKHTQREIIRVTGLENF